MSTCFTIAVLFAAGAVIAGAYEEYSLATSLGLPAIVFIAAGSSCCVCHSINGMNCCLFSNWVNSLLCLNYGLLRFKG